jgi:glycine oxidase
MANGEAGEQTVLILGGGLMGLAVAHALACRGERVRVLSRRRQEAAGHVAAGMLAPHAEGLEGPLLELGQAGLERIPAWVAALEVDSGLPCGLRHSGIVVPFASPAARDTYPTAAWGVPLDRGDLERQVAGIGPCWRAGLLFPQDGQIDSRRRLMRALEGACRRRGVAIEEGGEALALLRRGERLEGVRLRGGDGTVRDELARRAVLCCGAWSAALLPELAVFPVKGQMVSLQAPIGALQRVLFGPGTYLVPREDGLVVVGATSEAEAGFGPGLTPAGLRQLEGGVAALLPEATRWPPMERWWGFRPGTPDGAPLLGPGPLEGLWLCTGHHRNGVLLAAVSAEAVAAELNGNQRRLGLEPFRWSRFKAGEADRQP